MTTLGKDGGVTRRKVLAASALVPLAAALPQAAGAQARKPVADAHIHLFNASDLPIANFVNYVMVPGFLEAGPPLWATAIVDMFANFFRVHAMTAEAELGRLTGPAGWFGGSGSGWTPERFAAEAARFMEGRRASRAPAGADGLESPSGPSLADSYDALLGAAVEDSGLEGTGNVVVSPAAERLRTREALRGIAREAEADALAPAPPAPPPADDGLEGASGGACPAAPFDASLAHGRRLLGWGYLMLRTRREHVEEYLARHGAATHETKLLISHLVDYDLWLDDAPRKKSAHLTQIRVMDALRRRYDGKVEIRTFAGFCPLRLAVERQEGKAPLFEAYKAEAAAKRIAGFKLYPPMGFRPSGNAAMAGSGDEGAVFDPGYAGMTSGYRRWKAAGGGALGKALDGSLDEFFGYCAAARLPVMAHAGPGNGAGKGYGERANPLGWVAVAGRHAIRLSLGHLVNSARDFVTAARGPRPFPDCVWSLHASVALLDPSRGDLKATVYGDLGYMPELINDPALATEFFRSLRDVFGRADPQLTRILYGTDWIMMGHERNNSRYLEAVVAAMGRAGYSEEQKHNILYANARRFLAG